MIGDDKVAEIRERTDVVALIGEYVALRRVGAQFRGLCPFHAEKSPSFYVHPARQFFHCFGCKASGDSIAFVMRLEGMTFPDALRRLAERAGIEIPDEDPREEIAARRARLEQSRLVAALDAAAGFFVAMLAEHPHASLARAELEARGVTPETAQTFRLGYAPSGWDELATFLASRDISPRDAEIAGVLAPRRSGSGHYDRFRHRLVFPVSDVHGRIVAFSGRILPPPPGAQEREQDGPPAKYVNSPETPLYHKGELLFGLHEGRVALRREDHAVLCEGNFDVLAIHQAGMPNVVAPLGTALTAAHAKLLRRYVSRVTLVFDADGAGRKATRASFPLLAAEAIATRVAALPAGEDPDSFVRAHGAEALEALIAAAPPALDHLVDAAATEAGTDPAARAAAIAELGPLLASVTSPVERGLWVERVAQAFQIQDIEAVRRELRRGLRDVRGPRRPRGEAAEPAAEAPAPELSRELVETEGRVVGVLLDHASLLSSESENVSELLTSEALRAIVRDAARMVGQRGAVDATALIRATDHVAARSWLEERLAREEFGDEASARRWLADTAIPLLRKRKLQSERDALRLEIKRARAMGDSERVVALMAQELELGREMARG